jgi:hypothetical protein
MLATRSVVVNSNRDFTFLRLANWSASSRRLVHRYTCISAKPSPVAARYARFSNKRDSSPAPNTSSTTTPSSTLLQPRLTGPFAALWIGKVIDQKVIVRKRKLSYFSAYLSFVSKGSSRKSWILISGYFVIIFSQFSTAFVCKIELDDFTNEV